VERLLTDAIRALGLEGRVTRDGDPERQRELLADLAARALERVGEEPALALLALTLREATDAPLQEPVERRRRRLARVHEGLAALTALDVSRRLIEREFADAFVSTFLEAWRTRRPEPVLESVADDVQYFDDGRPEPVRGIGAARELIGLVTGALSDFQADLVAGPFLHPDAPQLAIHWRYGGVHSGPWGRVARDRPSLQPRRRVDLHLLGGQGRRLAGLLERRRDAAPARRRSRTPGTSWECAGPARTRSSPTTCSSPSTAASGRWARRGCRAASTRRSGSTGCRWRWPSRTSCSAC
jgi:hypothetical protein